MHFHDRTAHEQAGATRRWQRAAPPILTAETRTCRLSLFVLDTDQTVMPLALAAVRAVWEPSDRPWCARFDQDAGVLEMWIIGPDVPPPGRRAQALISRLGRALEDAGIRRMSACAEYLD